RRWGDGVGGRGGAGWAASRGPDRTSTNAELEALDLAGGRLGQIAHEFDPAWILVGCNLVSHEALELVGQRRRGAGRLFEDDERLRLDQPIAVFLTDDGDFQHSRVFYQRGLDLDGRDPDTADLQHVIGAAGVPEVTVLVLPILVSGLDPRTEERLLGPVVLVPVEGHRGVALDAQIADLAPRHRPAVVVHDRRLIAGHGHPRGARPNLIRTVREKDVKDLRGPDPVDDFDAEPLAPARVDLIGQRLAGRHADAQRGEIEALLRLLDGEHAGVEGRHAEED